MPAYPITDQEELDNIIDEITLNPELVAETTTEHEFLQDSSAKITMVDGRQFLVAFWKVVP